MPGKNTFKPSRYKLPSPNGVSFLSSQTTKRLPLSKKTFARPFRIFESRVFDKTKTNFSAVSFPRLPGMTLINSEQARSDSDVRIIRNFRLVIVTKTSTKRHGKFSQTLDTCREILLQDPLVLLVYSLE